jgi:lysine-specific demethylase/histidyl-hydroxylase NO66
MTGLARCVGDVERFLAHHWTRAPLHRHAADTGGFDDLLSLDDVDTILATTAPRQPSFRLVRDGVPLDSRRYTRTIRLGGKSVSGVADPGKVFEEFRQGATIVLQGLQRTWLPLSTFCRELELELTHPVQVNAYITPPGAQGLAVHYDTHDVFVLQVEGHKEWSLFEPVRDDPLVSQPWSSDMVGDGPGHPHLELDLRAGDVLYVPRGWLHSARAQQDVSAHLTVGVLAQTWYDAVQHTLKGLVDEVWSRQALPAGYAGEGAEAALAAELDERLASVRHWLEKVDTAAVARQLTSRFWSNRPPVLAGQLRQVLALDRLDDASVVRRRPTTVCHLVPEDGLLTVLLGDRQLRMPAALEPPVRRLAGAGRMRVGDLADQLDTDSRLVLVRRLVREGLLEVVDPPESFGRAVHG